jgi:hypothetical protein
LRGLGNHLQDLCIQAEADSAYDKLVWEKSESVHSSSCQLVGEDESYDKQPI